MRHVISLLWVLALLMASAIIATAKAAPRFEVKQLVMEEAADSAVPVSLALAVAKVESDFNPKALSSKGARGVMQIMPQTARGEFGVSAHRLWDARTNIQLGIRFLEQLHDQYHGNWELALSHYNGGTVTGRKPHTYTLAYIRKVTKWRDIYEEQASLWAPLGAEEKEDTDWVELTRWEERDLNETAGVEWTLDDDFWEDETEVVIVERPANRATFRPKWRQHPPHHHRLGGGLRRPPPRFH